MMWQPGMTLEDTEKKVVLAAYAFYRENKTQTALALNISFNTLASKLEKYTEKVVTRDSAEMNYRKVEATVRHYFGDKSKAANHLGMSLAKVEEALKYEVNGKATDSGSRVESTTEISKEPTLPVPERKEIQSVLPAKDSSGSHKRSSEKAATA